VDDRQALVSESGGTVEVGAVAIRAAMSHRGHHGEYGVAVRGSAGITIHNSGDSTHLDAPSTTASSSRPSAAYTRCLRSLIFRFHISPISPHITQYLAISTR